MAIRVGDVDPPVSGGLLHTGGGICDGGQQQSKAKSSKAAKEVRILEKFGPRGAHEEGHMLGKFGPRRAHE